MEIIFENREIAFGHMTREEIEEQGFKDIVYVDACINLYANGDWRMAFCPEDNWFTRYKVENRIENRNA